MDRISNYRQVTLTLTVTPTGFVGSVFTRRASAGRIADRLLARQIVILCDPLSSESDIGPLLEEAVRAYNAGEYSPPR